MENNKSGKITFAINETSDEAEPPSLRLQIAERKSNLKIISRKICNADSFDLPVSNSTQKFIKKHYPGLELSDWNNWKWQIKNSIVNLNQLGKIIDLTDNEIKLAGLSKKSLPLRITPYYASLLSETDAYQAIRKSVVPTIDEFIIEKGEASDPLEENNDMPEECIVHRYPDRALFLVTGFCSTYCRYCTRTHMVAKEKCHFQKDILERGFDYIRKHKEVRDVLISGGDPFTMSDAQLEYILRNLKEIPSVEFIRIGTKVPAVLPQRITSSFVNMLKKYSPLWLSIHFTHPDEITEEVKIAVNRLADAGFPLGSQTVLLKDVNDNIDTMKALMHSLLKIRVRPYYLYQCDPILGSSHFRTHIEKGIEIIKGLRGHTTGYAVPHFVIDAPGGGGKIPLLPEYYVGRDNDSVILRNYENKLFKYPDAEH